MSLLVLIELPYLKASRLTKGSHTRRRGECQSKVACEVAYVGTQVLTLAVYSRTKAFSSCSRVTGDGRDLFPNRGGVAGTTVEFRPHSRRKLGCGEHHYLTASFPLPQLEPCIEPKASAHAKAFTNADETLSSKSVNGSLRVRRSVIWYLICYVGSFDWRYVLSFN